MAEWLSTEVLLGIIILIVYIIGAEFIEIKQIDFIHESGVAILLGIFVGFIIKYGIGTPITFDESSLFYFILPPIIFSAGFTFKRKNFINNFSYIYMFGVFGTFISMLVLSFLIIKVNSWMFSSRQYKDFKLTTYEGLLLSSILCASDSIAALTIVKKRDYPKLNSILFGEGIINDAVSILIFRSVEDLISASRISIENESDKNIGDTTDNNLKRLLYYSLDFTIGDAFYMFYKFLIISFLSILLGLAFGLAASFIGKNIPTLKIHPAREVFLILLIAYLSYVISEMGQLSGIMTIFGGGMVMSYYTLYNLSNKSRKGSQLAVETLGHAAEAFLFAYMGLTLFGIEENQISIEFSFFILFGTFIARALSILIPYVISVKGFGIMSSLDFNQLMIIWFSGLVKGAIAFGLSLQISSSLTLKKTYMVSTTLSIVMISTILLGGLMSFFANGVGLSKEKEMLKKMYATFGNKNEILNQNENNGNDEPRNRGKIHLFKITAYAYMRSIDELIMRPYFGGATEEDEEREREEEMIEEEEHIRGFAEQHFNRYEHENDEYVEPEQREMIRTSKEFGEFSYQRRSGSPLKVPHVKDAEEEFMDIEILNIDHNLSKKNSEEEGI